VIAAISIPYRLVPAVIASHLKPVKFVTAADVRSVAPPLARKAIISVTATRVSVYGDATEPASNIVIAGIAVPIVCAVAVRVPNRYPNSEPVKKLLEVFPAASVILEPMSGLVEAPAALAIVALAVIAKPLAAPVAVPVLVLVI
jgi:hypothetical protein